MRIFKARQVVNNVNLKVKLKMNFSRKSRILIASVILVISGIQGQLDGSMKICDLCNMDGIRNCNSSNIFHINLTVNCEMKMYTLGINESFEGFENLTLHDIDQEHICIFKEINREAIIISTNVVTTAGSSSQLMTTTEANQGDNEPNVESSFDTQLNEFMIVSDDIEGSPTIEMVSTETTEEYSSLGFSAMESPTPTSPITTPLGSFGNLITETETEETTAITMMTDEQHTDLSRSLKESSEKSIEANTPSIPISAVGTVSCLACESSTDEACIGRIDELKAIDCPRKNGCTSFYLNGNIVRNCGSILSSPEAELCRQPSNYSCDICYHAGCNKKTWNQCFQCNSKIDPNCALWSVAETVPFAICPNYNDNCLIRIKNEGDTLRECSPPDTKCLEAELCLVCEGPLCNSGVFPENRLLCIQCQECEEYQDPNNALPCLHYNVNEECFMYVTAKSRIIRGCVSNVTEMQKCQHNEPKCIKCDKENGCNNSPLMRVPTLSCSKCKSKDNPSCAWYQAETSVSKCVNKFLYYLTETCLTQFNLSSQEAVRDCSFDYGACTSEDHDCLSCTENGCNRANLKVQQCIQCQSDKPGQVECRNQAMGIPPTKCIEKIQTFESRGCFTMTKGNVTTRGCVASLATDDSKLCNNKKQTSCEICMDDGCNHAIAPSIAGRTIHVSLIALFGSFLTVI